MTAQGRNLIKAAVCAAFGIGLFPHHVFAGATQFDLQHGWVDRGGTTHLAKGITVDLWDDDSPLSDDHIGIVTTSAGGIAHADTDVNDGPTFFDSTIEIYTFPRSEMPGVGVVTPTFGSGGVWQTVVPPTSRYLATVGINNGVIGFPNVDTTTEAGRGISILHAIGFAKNYWVNTISATVPALIEIQYYNAPAASPDRGSYAINATMNIGYNDWSSWDVMFHEFGHIVAQYNGLDTRPGLGFTHSYGVDSINRTVATSPTTNHTITKAEGTQLAWQEGIATYIGLATVKYGNLQGAIPGMPAAEYNKRYESFPNNGAANINVGIETRNDGSGNVGEGDEASVMRILWDLADSDDTYDGVNGEAYAHGGDRWALGPASVYAKMKMAGGTLSGFWKTMRTAGDPAQKAKLGEVFEEYGVSDIPLTSGLQSTSIVRLRMREQNNSDSEHFKFLVYDTSWALKASSPEFDDDDLTHINNWFWDTPALPDGNYYYVVLNSSVLQGAVSIDDSYWSSAAAFTVPEPAGMAMMALVGAAALLRRRKRA